MQKKKEKKRKETLYYFYKRSFNADQALELEMCRYSFDSRFYWKLPSCYFRYVANCSCETDFANIFFPTHCMFLQFGHTEN